MPKFYWEDFKVGETAPLGERTLSKEEIIAYAKQYDPQPFHVDEEAGKQSLFGGLVASGWHTCAVGMRLMCDSYLLDSAGLGSPGLENLRWLRPVRPGDTLRMQRTVLESRPSSSRPDVGIVKMRWEMHNQRGEQVLSMEGAQMFRRRDAEKV
jgi:acyl dehydratase